MTGPSAGAETGNRSGRLWWLRMLAASVALGAVPLLALWLAPPARLHYHAWRYRRARERLHLDAAAAVLLEKGATVRSVKRLLGEPLAESAPAGGGRTLQYSAYDPAKDWLWSLNFEKCMIFRGGRVVRVEWINSFSIPPMVEFPRPELPGGTLESWPPEPDLSE